MVAGDLVNTASRIQSAAEPGHRARRRVDEARVGGGDRLRGRGQPRAQGQGRAGAALAGAARGRRPRGARCARPGLEAPFVGRDRELRLVKELFHASADEQRRSSSRSRASPASASRGSRGSSRSTSTGSPTTSSGIAAAASPTARASRTGRSPRWCGCAAASSRTRSRRSARAKLRATIEEHIPDPEERRWVEPRLAHLLGLEEGRARRPGEPLLGLADPVRAARRAVADGPRVRGHAVGRRGPARLPRVPARVVAQPSAVRARRSPGPSWPTSGPPGAPASAASPPSTSSRSPRRRWASCWPASSRGCPTSCATRILERAEGVPLYAVETVRMLLDRGLLTQEGNVYRPTGAGRDARGAGDAARPRRGAPRRPDARRAAPRPGRRRARQDVHEAGSGGAHRPGR